MSLVKVRCSKCNRFMLVVDHRSDNKNLECGRKTCKRLKVKTNLYKVQHSNKLKVN